MAQVVMAQVVDWVGGAPTDVPDDGYVRVYAHACARACTHACTHVCTHVYIRQLRLGCRRPLTEPMMPK